MSSNYTLQVAQNELGKAEELERQAQHALDTVQQEVDKFRQEAQVHRNEYSRLMSQAQEEQRHEAEEMANRAREEQKKRDNRF